MIPVEQVYDTLLSLIREDKRGLALSPDEFNRLAKIVNERVYQKKIKNFEIDSDSSESLAKFKDVNATAVLAAGTLSLPSDFYKMIGKPRIVNNSSETRRCDMVSQLEYDERYEDYLTQPSETYPVFTLGELDGSDNIIMHVYPTTITGTVTFDYLKKAATPIYDYYVNNTTLVVTYMDAGTTVTIPSGSTYRNGTAGDGATTFASTSVDWDWDEEDMELILSIFCQLLGIAMPDELMIQSGNLEEAKTE